MKRSMVNVRAEAEADVADVRAVHDAAFGRPDEARLVDALRQRARPYLGFVALEHGRVAGHVAFSGATLHCYGALFEILALGPMAVLPRFQRRGVGSVLVPTALAACHEAGHDIVVVVGHPAFYPRFGFVPARPKGLLCEYDVPDDAFMVAELAPDALRNRRGVVYYAPEFRLVAG
jgi:putative acetyltransferase